MTSRSSSERSEASQAFIFLRDSATKRRETADFGCRRHALSPGRPRQTDRAVVLAGRHVQDHQVERPLEQQVAIASACQLSKLTSLPARSRNPWPGHLHFVDAVVADLATCPAPR